MLALPLMLPDFRTQAYKPKTDGVLLPTAAPIVLKCNLPSLLLTFQSGPQAQLHACKPVDLARCLHSAPSLPCLRLGSQFCCSCLACECCCERQQGFSSG